MCQVPVLANFPPGVLPICVAYASRERERKSIVLGCAKHSSVMSLLPNRDDLLALVRGSHRNCCQLIRVNRIARLLDTQAKIGKMFFVSLFNSSRVKTNKHSLLFVLFCCRDGGVARVYQRTGIGRKTGSHLPSQRHDTGPTRNCVSVVASLARGTGVPPHGGEGGGFAGKNARTVAASAASIVE